MTRFKVDFDGVIDRLEELEQENWRLRAEISEQRERIAALEEEKRQLIVGFEAVNANARLHRNIN